MGYRYMTSRYDTMRSALTAAREQVEEYEAQARRLQAIRAWTEYREARLRCLLNLATVGYPPKTSIVIEHSFDSARDQITSNLHAWAAWIRASGREGRRWDDEMVTVEKPFFKRIGGSKAASEGDGYFRGRQLLAIAYNGCNMKYFVEYVERAVEDYGATRGPPDCHDDTAFGIVNCLGDLSHSVSEIVRESRTDDDRICYSAAFHSDASGAHLLRPGVPIFRIGDEITEILFDRRRATVKTGTGVRHLKALVDQQGNEVRSLELMNGGSIILDLTAHAGGRRMQEEAKVIGNQSSQPVNDRRAELERDARLAALPQEIEDADARGDGAASAELKDEQAGLERQRKADAGRTGQSREFVNDGEKARQAVKKAIDAAIDRIEKVDPALGLHLRSSVKCGVKCRYDPPATPS